MEVARTKVAFANFQRTAKTKLMLLLRFFYTIPHMQQGLQSVCVVCGQYGQYVSIPQIIKESL